MFGGRRDVTASPESVCRAGAPLPHQIQLSEADTRAKLIDPAIHACEWTEESIRRDETAGAIDILQGMVRKGLKGRVKPLARA